MPQRLCARCEKADEGRTGLLSFAGCVYHPACFVCERCGEALKPETAVVRDGKLFHEHPCLREVQALALGTSCAVCGKPASPFQKEVISIGQQLFHPKCFCCAGCGEGFGRGARHFKWEGKPYHELCVDELRQKLRVRLIEEDPKLFLGSFLRGDITYFHLSECLKQSCDRWFEKKAITPTSGEKQPSAVAPQVVHDGAGTRKDVPNPHARAAVLGKQRRAEEEADVEVDVTSELRAPAKLTAA
eukprot:RCo027553